MTPAVDRTVRRTLRQPSDAQVAALLAAGWSPAPRVGVWIDASASDRRMWWERALELAAADRARNAGTA